MRQALRLALATVLALLAACRPDPRAGSAVLDDAEAPPPWLVKVSSTFRGETKADGTLRLGGFGFVVRHDAPDGSRWFVVTASHLSQGGVEQASAEEIGEDEIDLTIETLADEPRRLAPINRLASVRRDVEVIHVREAPGLVPLAVVDTRRPATAPWLADAHPHGWLRVTDAGARDVLRADTLGARGSYLLGRDAYVPQAEKVRPLLRSPLHGVERASLSAAIEATTDLWRKQVLRHGFDLAGDEIAAYRRLPGGFSGAPLVLRVGDETVVLGLVTSYSRAFDLSWIAPSAFITRTIDLYVRNRLDRFETPVGVRLNEEAWRLRRGLLYRVGRYDASLGHAQFSEVSPVNPPAGNGSSSPGGNGSSSPGGNGSSSPGGNGSSSPGGDAAEDPFARFGIGFGALFGAPGVTGGVVERALGFVMTIRALGREATHLADPNMAAINIVLNGLDPRQSAAGPVRVATRVVSRFEDWLDEVAGHLGRAAFTESPRGTWTRAVKLVALGHAASPETRQATVTVVLGGAPERSLTVRMTLDDVPYASRTIRGADELAPFLRLEAPDGSGFAVSVAGLLSTDDSMRSPFDELVESAAPVELAPMRALNPKIKFPLRIGDEDYLVVDP